MPIYEYACKKCGYAFEKMQKISDAPITICPQCGGEVAKKISLSGFQFKGAGWYVTDYSNKGKPETAKSEAKSETGGETKTETAKTSDTAVTTPTAPKASDS